MNLVWVKVFQLVHLKMGIGSKYTSSSYRTFRQAWGQSSRYFGTRVPILLYSELIFFKSTCTRTCTRILLKTKEFLTCRPTYEYFTSTRHLKYIQNNYRQILNYYRREMELSACLPACLPACLHVSLSACLPALPVCPPVRLSVIFIYFTDRRSDRWFFSGSIPWLYILDPRLRP